MQSNESLNAEQPVVIPMAIAIAVSDRMNDFFIPSFYPCALRAWSIDRGGDDLTEKNALGQPMRRLKYWRRWFGNRTNRLRFKVREAMPRQQTTTAPMAQVAK
jgi:hypothetical protein